MSDAGDELMHDIFEERYELERQLAEKDREINELKNKITDTAAKRQESFRRTLAEIAKRDALLEFTKEYLSNHDYQFVHIAFLQAKNMTCNCFKCKWFNDYAQLRAGGK